MKDHKESGGTEVNDERIQRDRYMIAQREKTAPAAETDDAAQGQSADFRHAAARVRQILANCGLPIEQIFREILIPKLYAKKTIILTNGGKPTETKMVDDHFIQLRTALELAKMCGCYADEDAELEVAEASDINWEGASDNDLRTIVAIAASLKK